MLQLKSIAVRMKNKKIGTALITGAAKRIGRKMALELAAQGYDIVISYNNSANEAKKLSAEIAQKFSVKCEIFQCDLVDQNQAKKLAEFMVENFANWNLLINNASIFNKSKFLDTPEEEGFDNFNIHFFAPLILSKKFAQNVKAKKIQNAQIINMIDKNIARFDTNYFYYLLSKKFLAEFTKMLALEIAPEVRVNGIAPGFILNSIDEENPSIETENLLKRIPLKTKGEVENILQAVEFLLKNKFVNGQILFIDGGASLNHAG
jgi:pteridine reductase